MLKETRRKMDAIESRQQAYEQQNEEMLESQKAYAVELGNRCRSLELRVDNLERLLDGYANIITNIKNNNAQLEFLRQDIDRAVIKLKKIEGQSFKGSECVPDYKVKTHPVELDIDSNSYESIDYFDFENHFRGSREVVKERQCQYLQYFQDCKQVIDIGCGRGEFLELLKENGISALGVDSYEEFTSYCMSRGLNAVTADGIKYLQQAGTVDGIFVGQVVEHLKLEQIIALCNAAYKKLCKEGCLVIETPNPTSLAIYTHAFYVDPSHIKPVHPLTMQYLLEKAGFKNIEIVYTEASKLETVIPELKLEAGTDIQAFNKVMHIVSDTLFGSQDYAIIAKK